MHEDIARAGLTAVVERQRRIIAAFQQELDAIREDTDSVTDIEGESAVTRRIFALRRRIHEMEDVDACITEELAAYRRRQYPKRLFLSTSQLDCIIGDLREACALKVNKVGLLRARFWLCKQVVFSVGPLLKQEVQSRISSLRNRAGL